MAMLRMTQNMMTERSFTAMQTAAGRLAKIQEQASTGKVLNRPSDSPSDSTASMRTRAELGRQRQYQRNADDGNAWMTLQDSAMEQATNTLQRARDLAVQSNNAVAQSQQSREAVAAEIDVLRQHLIGVANTTYLERPIFGGNTGGKIAYDTTGAYVGDTGSVERVIGDNTSVQVNVNGPDAFGDSMQRLADLAAALRAGDMVAADAAQQGIADSTEKMVQTRASKGATHRQIQTSQELAQSAELRITSALSNIEDADLPMTLINLKSQEVAYQAALQTTAKVIQPSLMDYLRG